MKNLPAPDCCRNIDREQDDQGRRHIDRDAENAFQRNEEVADQTGQVVAAMCPRRRQVRPEHRIGNEQYRHHRHDQAGGAPCRLQQQHNKDHADDDVPAVGHGGAVGEIVTAPQGIDDCGNRKNAGHDVPPAHTVAKPRRQREQQEAQHQRECDVGVAKFLGRNDGVGRVQMKQAHHDGNGGRNSPWPAHQAVGRALFGFDE
jgi:hypothetical protein